MERYKVYNVQVFQARNGQWCWRAIARNGRELFRQSETHKRYDYTVANANAVAAKYKGCCVVI